MFRKLVPAGILAIAASVGGPAAAQSAAIIKYCISVKTFTDSGSGTDNHIEMSMFNKAGFDPVQMITDFASGKASDYADLRSEKIWLQGSHENNDLDEFEHEMPDMGIVPTIVLDVSGSLADKWAASYVRIYRKTSCSRKGDADGWTEFSIRKFLDYDPVLFHATAVHKPKVTVAPDGSVELNIEYLTIARGAMNDGSTAQPVMQYVEKWSRVDAVSVSSEKVDTLGAAASVGYVPPGETGGFTAEASASWERAIAEAREETTETITESEFNWEYEAPPRTYIMRRIRFEVPYTDQLYRASNGEGRAIRKVGSMIRPIDYEFIEIPRRDDDGAIRPVKLSVLEQEWFPYLEPVTVAEIERRHLPKWLSAGHVVTGAGPAPGVATLTAEGVNGLNVAAVEVDGAHFRQTQSGGWQELDTQGEVRFTFSETQRDDWSVYLNDAGRDLQLQLDLHRNMVSFGTGGGAKSDLYPITAAMRRN